MFFVCQPRACASRYFKANRETTSAVSTSRKREQVRLGAYDCLSTSHVCEMGPHHHGQLMTFNPAVAGTVGYLCCFIFQPHNREHRHRNPLIECTFNLACTRAFVLSHWFGHFQPRDDAGTVSSRRTSS